MTGRCHCETCVDSRRESRRVSYACAYVRAHERRPSPSAAGPIVRECRERVVADVLSSPGVLRPRACAAAGDVPWFDEVRPGRSAHLAAQNLRYPSDLD